MLVHVNSDVGFCEVLKVTPHCAVIVSVSAPLPITVHQVTDNLKGLTQLRGGVMRGDVIIRVTGILADSLLGTSHMKD
jgi:hypothetical protein